MAELKAEVGIVGSLQSGFCLRDDALVSERLKVECPSPTCGPGYFMAKDANRMHCGYCSTSLVQQQK